MADQPRSGIVGAGFIGTIHARAVHATGGVLTAVAEAEPEASARAADALRAQRACTVDELLSADDIDVVHICTPNYLHVPLALKALNAGKHVICEKPLATSPEDARAIMRAAEEANAVAVVPFAYRFYPTVREARVRIQSGDTGRVRLFHGHYLQDWMAAAQHTNWRVDTELGGTSRAFADIGVHWCDLLEFVTGQRIVRLTARMLTVHPERVGHAVATEDVATVMLETDAGALGALVLSQVSPGRKNRLWFECDGEFASVAFDQEAPDWLWVGSVDGNMSIPRGSAAMSASAQRLSVTPSGHPQGYQDCFNALVADTYSALAGNAADGLPTFRDGYRAAVLTQAVLDAARTETWVEVHE